MRLISARRCGFTLGLLTVVLLAGCASTVLSPISESEKDPAGTYDGTWSATVLRSPATQYGPGNWVFNCNGESWGFAFRVKESIGRIEYSEKEHIAYVDRNGRFRFEVPLNEDVKVSDTSDSTIQRGERTMIINGSLKSASGRITYGIAEFGNQGCTAKIAFVR